MGHTETMRAESAIIINLLKERNVRVNVTGGYVTPGFYVYHLRMDASQKYKALADCATDMERLLYSGRLSRRAIDVNDPDQRVVVRITDQPLAIEINRPTIDVLAYDVVRNRSNKLRSEYVAMAGVSYASKDGQAVGWRLADSSEPHCLVAGGTGSGKSALLLTLMMSLCENTSPQRLRLLIIDGGNSTLKPLAKLAHAIGYAGDADEALLKLRAVARELMRRKQSDLSDDRIRDRVVAVIDELANLQAVMDKKQVEELQKVINFITGEGRKYGVHCVTCTQKPLAEVTGTLTKTNSAKRFVGAVPSKTDAVTCAGIGDTGAEALAGKGDFITVRNGRVQRFQAAYIANPLALVDRINLQWMGVRVEPLDGGTVAGTQPVRSGTEAVRVPAVTSGTGTYQSTKAVDHLVVENEGSDSDTYQYEKLDDVPPTRRQRIYLQQLYDKFGSKNKVLEIAYAGVVNDTGKTPKTKRWLDEALSDNVPARDNKIIRLRQTA